MTKLQLIAFDLDGTFLDDAKRIPEINMEALLTAREQGVLIVPATGRLYKGLPDEVRELCRYFILINGAKVYDAVEDRVLYSADIPLDLALKIYDYGDTLPCVYDAYVKDDGRMSQRMFDVMEDYLPDKNYAKMMRVLRKPVPDLKQSLIGEQTDVQKAQYYFQDLEERERQIRRLDELFPGQLYVSTSLESNIEINYYRATKGRALRGLCQALGIDCRQAAAFGDGTNDLSMIEDAGFGVAMCNGAERCRAAADFVTEYNNNAGGFGRELLKLLNYQKT